jgi:hypothetical protein
VDLETSELDLGRALKKVWRLLVGSSARFARTSGATFALMWLKAKESILRSLDLTFIGSHFP